jgi:cysteinyl-tRNA synthetase
LRTHYRTALNYSDAHLDDAEAGLKRLYTALDFAFDSQSNTVDWTESFAARFKAAMDEDFGTPDAVSVLFELAAEVNRTRSTVHAALLKMLGNCLGILQQNPCDFLQAGAVLSEADILEKIAQRAEAKAAKNFAQADQIRKDLLANGIVLKDSATGTAWESV